MTPYKTTNMEAAARTLCDTYKLVVALNWLRNSRRLALRPSALSDVQIYRVTAKAKAEAEIRAWRKTGGLYLREYYGRPDYGHTQGLLFAEAPHDLECFERDSAPCTDATVIYRPPSWLDHENTLTDMFPPATIAKRFWETLEIFSARPRKPLHEAMLKIMGLPSSGVVCVPKAEFYKTANISSGQMWRIVKADAHLLDKQRAGRLSCNAVILRFEPQNKDQLALYRWIAENCQRYLNWHIIKTNEPRALFPRWKDMLRHMSYGSFLQREDEVNFYMPSGAKPDFSVYDLELKRARARLKQVIQFVEQLPELPLAAQPDRPCGSLSGSRESPSGPASSSGSRN